MSSNTRSQLPDPAQQLLRQREVQALKVILGVRFLLVIIMAPLVWVLGQAPFDRIATSVALLVYLVAIAASAALVWRQRRLGAVGLVGVGLDVVFLSALPFIWYTALGGSDIPAGLTLKTSITVISLIFIALNALAMRPIYPALVAIGVLFLHFALLGIALADGRSPFTDSYLIAYTTGEISRGGVAIRMIVVAMVGVILTLLTASARRTIIDAVKLQTANVQLGRYFSPNLVPQLIESSDLFQVGGERRELSFVFTDLEGFTSLVEANEPAVVVPLLNQYLDGLVQIAFRHDGTVDKIVGDAVHVIFGAPVSQPDHAERAVACALEMDAFAERYRRDMTDGARLGVTRIGINSGPAIVGNFGGDALFDYTAHGDSINTAARLEGANKYLGTRVCVSIDTVERMEIFHGRPIGTLVLKGKTQGLEAEPLPAAVASSPETEDYRQAYDLMKDERPEAVDRFETIHEKMPDDPVVRLHLERLRCGESGTRLVLTEK